MQQRASVNAKPVSYGPVTYHVDASGDRYHTDPRLSKCQGCGYHEDKPYEQLRRQERECRWPDHFKRWPEDEHPGQRTLFSWDEQLTHWAHMEAWDHYHDREWTLAEAQAQIARLEPEVPYTEMVARLSASFRNRRYWDIPKALPLPPAPPEGFLRPIEMPA